MLKAYDVRHPPQGYDDVAHLVGCVLLACRYDDKYVILCDIWQGSINPDSVFVIGQTIFYLAVRILGDILGYEF